MRLVHASLLILAVVIVGGVGAAAWLVVTHPQPRTAPRWSLGPPLPAARGELAAAVGYAYPCQAAACPEAERLYVVGGLSRLFKPERAVTIYDLKGGAWTIGPSLPAPRHHLAAARLGHDVYVSGGTDVAGVRLGHQHWPPRANFWRLAAGGGEWQTLPQMIEPRWGHRMVAHDGHLYVVGGRGPSGRVLIYTEAGGWRLGAALPRMRDHLSVVVAQGRVWAIGGRDPGSVARVDIYDPAADRWEPGPDLPHPTSGAAEAVINDVIFVFGGEEPDFLAGEVIDRHWRLNTRSAAPRWEPAPSPPLAVHGTNAAVLDDTIAIAGGATRHGALSVAGWTSALQLMRRAPERR